MKRTVIRVLIIPSIVGIGLGYAIANGMMGAFNWWYWM